MNHGLIPFFPYSHSLKTFHIILRPLLPINYTKYLINGKLTVQIVKWNIAMQVKHSAYVNTSNKQIKLFEKKVFKPILHSSPRPFIFISFDTCSTIYWIHYWLAVGIIIQPEWEKIDHHIRAEHTQQISSLSLLQF